LRAKGGHITRKGAYWHREITWEVDEKDCWICTSHRQTKLVYPRVKINGVMTRINRYHYELYKGPIPLGLIVRHTCDNKRCINPEHLILGTNKDNARDAVERDLAVRGERHGMHKLSTKQVEYIRVSTKGATALADELRVSARTIYYVRSYKTRKRG
jgi:hypothetical protein